MRTISFKQGELFKEKKEFILKDLRDPITLLEYLKKKSYGEDVFLLLDFNEALRDALVRRLLKDVIKIFRGTNNTIVIFSSSLDLADSLAQDIYMLDFPLPSKEKLKIVLRRTLDQLKNKNVRINLNKMDKEKLITSGQGLTTEQFESCIATAVIANRG